MGMLRTEWKVVTTEEISGTLLVGLSFGKIYFESTVTGEKMTVKYRCINIGAGKGPPAGAAWSNISDPSGGFDNVGVMPGHYFGPLSFPCRGYLLGAGASSGVLGSILGMDVTGGGVTMALFGIVPVFAGIRLWGLGRGALPGGGLTGGVALFQLDS